MVNGGKYINNQKDHINKYVGIKINKKIFSGEIICQEKHLQKWKHNQQTTCYLVKLKIL
jgi:hypothetical protein